MVVLSGLSRTAAKLRVRTPAGVECCLAVWAAQAPEREPLGEAARRVQAAMRPRARAMLRRLDRTVPGWPLRAVNSFYRVETDDFADALAQLRADDPQRLALDFLCGSNETCGGTTLRTRPDDVVRDVLAVVESFWRSGFQEIYAGQHGQLERLAEVLARRAAADPERALARFSPRAVLDRGADRLTFVGGQRHDVVPCADLERLDLIPSLWLRRRLVVAHAPCRTGLAAPSGAAFRHELDASAVSKILATLGDARRLEIFRLCLERPRTTSELAPILGITEGPVSRHLKELERRGLVVGQRYGRHVTYTPVVEVLDLVAQRLQSLPQDVARGAAA